MINTTWFFEWMFCIRWECLISSNYTIIYCLNPIKHISLPVGPPTKSVYIICDTHRSTSCFAFVKELYLANPSNNVPIKLEFAICDTTCTQPLPPPHPIRCLNSRPLGDILGQLKLKLLCSTSKIRLHRMTVSHMTLSDCLSILLSVFN